jgi:hypothetical protein
VLFTTMGTSLKSLANEALNGTLKNALVFVLLYTIWISIVIFVLINHALTNGS